jgi:hypothetical protein
MAVEGLPTSMKNKPVSVAKNGATSNKLRELYALAQEQKPQEGLPGAPASSPRQ